MDTRITSIITALIFRVQEYSIVTQALILMGLGMLWILLASFEDQAQNIRFIRVLVGGLALVIGAAMMFLIILMLRTIIMTGVYHNLTFIAGAGVFLMVFGALVESILEDRRR